MKVGSLCEVVKYDSSSGANNQAENLRSKGVVYPVKNVIYTVRGITPNNKGIYLEEIVNPPVIGGQEPAWQIEFLRELQPPMDIEEIVQMQHTKIEQIATHQESRR